MTDLINGRKPFTERHFPRLSCLQKLSNNVHFDILGILALTEKQCMPDCCKISAKIYFAIFYRFLQLLSAGKKIRARECPEHLKNHGMAHRLNTYCITFKIVEL